jgi:N-acetyl-anhydromuramyl-L-alanine amidase AmpD
LDLPADPSNQAQTQFTSGKLIFRPSCTFESSNQPEYIVLHATGGNTLEGAVATLRKEGGASIHYVIDRDGTVVQMLPESLAAHHVTCQSDTCLSTKSIGIELVNQGHVNPDVFKGLIYKDPLRAFNYPYWEDYPLAQRRALRILVQDVTARWGIPLDQEHVLGHFQLNPKTDPGPALNLWWDRPGDLLSPIFDTAE